VQIIGASLSHSQLSLISGRHAVSATSRTCGARIESFVRTAGCARRGGSSMRLLLLRERLRLIAKRAPFSDG